MDWQGYAITEEQKGNVKAIWIDFPYTTAKYKVMKEIKAKWSGEHKLWYLPANDRNRELFGLPKKYIYDSQLMQVEPINREALIRFVDELILRSYSPNTIRVYVVEFLAYLRMLKHIDVNTFSPERLRSYFLYLAEKEKLSENTIHSRLNALKFYYEKVLHNEKIFLEIPRPRKASKLPKVLSKSEIIRLFNTFNNPKHLLLIKVCYGMGLRVSEIVNLKVSDINSDRMQVLIEGAKGKKDRYVQLPSTILTELRNYYKEYKPKKYLFEGKDGGKMAVRTIQGLFHSAMKKAKINKPIGIHGLRHSYATHLLEYGTDISFIKELLGHNQIATTLIYTHVAKPDKKQIESPLDRL